MFSLSPLFLTCGFFFCFVSLQKILHKALWISDTASWAAQNGHLHILEYLVERKYDKYDSWVCKYAARHGQLDCLKYLHETAKAPWNSDVVRKAHRNNQTDVYNTFSTTTVRYHCFGDTKTESYTFLNNIIIVVINIYTYLDLF